VEEIGVGRSREMLENADLVLYVIDGITDEDRAFLSTPQREKTITVWNKADITLPNPLPAEFFPPGKSAALSAKTAEGIETLCRLVAESLLDSRAESGPANPAAGRGDFSGAAGLGSERQKDLVDRAVFSLQEALSLADRKEAPELIAPFLREALNATGEITGEISTAGILEEMFSRFYVGK
jgi:tRNA modification GTPase